MAYGVLIILLSVLANAEDIDNSDPNLKIKPDGAMNYDTEIGLRPTGTTTGAIIMKETLKIPEATNKEKKSEDKKDETSN